MYHIFYTIGDNNSYILRVCMYNPRYIFQDLCFAEKQTMEILLILNENACYRL